MILLANIATQRISALNNLIKRKNKIKRNLIEIFTDLSLVHFSNIFFALNVNLSIYNFVFSRFYEINIFLDIFKTLRV